MAVWTYPLRLPRICALFHVTRRAVLAGFATSAALLPAGRVSAAEPIRVGLVLPLTGPFGASIGREVELGARLALEQHGPLAGGRPVELLVRDDTGVADVTKRLVQELIVNDHVAVVAGFGLTPLALAAAPVATQAKVPMIVMAAATSIITEQSPFIVRTSFTMAQNTVPLAQWAYDDGVRKAVTLVSDYGPGIDAEKAFEGAFTQKGGTVLDKIRVPLRNPDFAPFLERLKAAGADAVFLFVPNGQGTALMKEVNARGFREAGIRLLATGDVTDDFGLNDMGDAVLGMITSHHYSAAHPSAENRAYVDAFQAAHGFRPNLMAIGGYDGMRLILTALQKTGGDTNGAKLVEAMKGEAWLSPRGPVSIDPSTRDIVQNVYLRKVERRDGELWNIEFATIPNVRDPAKP
jgi:branched-chain amino acid transport system substrate-binding protein